MALIVVEGPSLLPQRDLLVSLLDSPVTQLLELPLPPTHPEELSQLRPMHRYLRPLLDYDPAAGPDTVLDGWYLSELAVSLVTATPLAPEQMYYLSLFLTSRAALTVVLSPPAAAIYELLRRYDPPLLEDTVKQLGFQYGCFQALSRYGSELLPPLLRLTRRRTLLDPGVLCGLAHLVARRAYDCVPPAPGFTTYIGPARPQVLLLGERRTTEDKREPAFVPWAEGSGVWLLRALLLSDLHRHPLGIANACDVDDPRELWQHLDCPPVIALGANSGRQLSRLRVPHATVPHPQYLRRFHHRYAPAFAALLDQVAGTTADELGWRPR